MGRCCASRRCSARPMRRIAKRPRLHPIDRSFAVPGSMSTRPDGIRILFRLIAAQSLSSRQPWRKVSGEIICRNTQDCNGEHRPGEAPCKKTRACPLLVQFQAIPHAMRFRDTSRSEGGKWRAKGDFRTSLPALHPPLCDAATLRKARSRRDCTEDSLKARRRSTNILHRRVKEGTPTPGVPVLAFAKVGLSTASYPLSKQTPYR